MAVFPKSQTNLYKFARQMLAGLAEHSDIFPSVSQPAIEALADALDASEQSQGDFEQAQAAAKSATGKKNRDNEKLKDRLLAALRMAESDCINTPGNLGYIGWSPRRPRSPIEVPGQPIELAAVFQGQGTIGLRWIGPQLGGAVSCYHVQRSDQPSGGGAPGPWTLIATSYQPEIKLSQQPRGIELLYRVIASNPAGDSMASNVAAAVL